MRSSSCFFFSQNMMTLSSYICKPDIPNLLSNYTMGSNPFWSSILKLILLFRFSILLFSYCNLLWVGKTQIHENKNVPSEIISTHWELTGLDLEQTFSPVNHKKYQQVCHRLLNMVEMIVLFYVHKYGRGRIFNVDPTSACYYSLGYVIESLHQGIQFS